MAQARPQWRKGAQDNGTPAFSVFEGSIKKSEKDDRDYRLIQLANGLKAMIIHDPTADKAAASLDVAVGHLYDPVSPVLH
jgi:insulysin